MKRHNFCVRINIWVLISVVVLVAIVITLLYAQLSRYQQGAYTEEVREVFADKPVPVIEEEPPLTGALSADFYQKSQLTRRYEVLSKTPGLVCWGDSLTTGVGGCGWNYPSILFRLMATDGYYIPVVNMGVAGEDTKTIMARAGALKIYADAFLIPAETIPVKMTFRAADGSFLGILRQGNIGFSTVTIAGVAGLVTVKQDSPYTKEFSYYFTRSIAGTPVQVPKDSQIINDGSYLYRDYLPIIFIGQNGVWATPAQLIDQQQAILDTFGRNKDRFLILGLTTGDAKSRAGLEAAMVQKWGNKYINLREYLSARGVYDAGLHPSAGDLEQMKQGSVPDILRYDRIHLNSAGYNLIAQVIYGRLKELRYIEK